MPLEFGSWAKDGLIYNAIRFPILGGGSMLIQVSMPETPPLDAQGQKVAMGVPTTQQARLALGIPLAALNVQELTDESVRKSAGCVGAVLEALDQNDKNPVALEAIRKSEDPDMKSALRFLGL